MPGSTSKFLSVDSTSNLPIETAAIATSAGAGDASKIVMTNSLGLVDVSLISPDEAETALATEDLAAGDMINLFNSAGVTKMRKADKATASAAKCADGFVLAAVLSGASGTYYTEGDNTAVAGLVSGDVGKVAYLGNAGATVTTATSTAGELLQPIGRVLTTAKVVVGALVDKGIIRA